MNAQGQLTEIVHGQGFMVFVPFSDTRLIEKHQTNVCHVSFGDGRVLSPQQRNKIHALIGDITDWLVAPGTNRKKRERHELETLREMGLLYLIDSLDDMGGDYDRHLVRRQLTQNYCNLTAINLFSLSADSPNALDMTTASDFIDWLVELCIIHGIPCIDTLLNRCEDTGRYLYACLANKRCCICGRPAQNHHVDHVGMGCNRKEILHLGMRAQALCGGIKGHHDEAHNIGQQSFDRKYHVYGIELDEELCGILKLRRR